MRSVTVSSRLRRVDTIPTTIVARSRLLQTPGWRFKRVERASRHSSALRGGRMVYQLLTDSYVAGFAIPHQLIRSLHLHPTLIKLADNIRTTNGHHVLVKYYRSCATILNSHDNEHVDNCQRKLLANAYGTGAMLAAGPRPAEKCCGLGEPILRCLEHRAAGGMGVVFTLFEGTEHR